MRCQSDEEDFDGTIIDYTSVFSVRIHLFLNGLQGVGHVHVQRVRLFLVVFVVEVSGPT